MLNKERRQSQLSFFFSDCQDRLLLGILPFGPCLITGHILTSDGEVFQFGQMEAGEFVAHQSDVVVMGDVQQHTEVDG